MAFRSIGGGDTLTIDWGSKVRTINVKAFVGLPRQTARKLEAAVNTWLGTHAEEGELIQVHVYSLSPLSYVTQRWANAKLSDIGDTIPVDWWKYT